VTQEATPIRRAAAGSPATTRTRAAAVRVSRAAASTRSPAGVSRTLREVRSSSRTPSSRSSRVICWLTAGCTIRSRCAARPKCSSSATVTKYCNALSSMPLIYHIL
jgi:hypothetical protein